MSAEVVAVIGWRYARAHTRTRRGYLSFISTVSLLGLVLGVVALTVVVAVMNGFDRELKRRILDVLPHLVITVDTAAGTEASTEANTEAGTEEMPPEWLRSLAQHPEVEAVAPFMQQSGLLMRAGRSHLVTIYGIVPAREAELSILPTVMLPAALQALNEPEHNLVLGAPIARYLGLEVGDELSLILPTLSAQGRTLKPTLGRVRVAGSFAAGSELDSSLVLMKLEHLQQLAGQKQQYRVRLRDIFAAPLIAKALADSGEVTVSDWTATQGDFFQTVKMEKIMMFVLLSFVIAVASFGIVSGLSMLVNTKQKEIAVLRTMGLSSFGIMAVFVVQAMTIAVPGIILGLLLGIPLALYIPEVMTIIESMGGGSMVKGTYFEQIPTELRLADQGVILLVTLLISLGAALYPAYRAARLSPVEGLRYE